MTTAPTTEETELVFVYGTLRRGGSNAFRMEGAEFIGTAKVEGALYAISWYPGLILGKDLGCVIGEVYQVGPEQMRALDEFEGLSAGEIEGSEYRRVKVPLMRPLEDIRYGVQLEAPCGETPEAWAYEWKGPVDKRKRIASGDWLDSIAGQPNAIFSSLLLLLLVALPVVAFSSPTVPQNEHEELHYYLANIYFGCGPAIGYLFLRLALKRKERMGAFPFLAGLLLACWAFISLSFLAREFLGWLK